MPFITERSLWQTPLAATFTSTSPRFGLSMSISSIFMGALYS